MSRRSPAVIWAYIGEVFVWMRFCSIHRLIWFDSSLPRSNNNNELWCVWICVHCIRIVVAASFVLGAVFFFHSICDSRWFFCFLCALCVSYSYNEWYYNFFLLAWISLLGEQSLTGNFWNSWIISVFVRSLSFVSFFHMLLFPSRLTHVIVAVLLNILLILHRHLDSAHFAWSTLISY